MTMIRAAMAATLLVTVLAACNDGEAPEVVTMSTGTPTSTGGSPAERGHTDHTVQPGYTTGSEPATEATKVVYEQSGGVAGIHVRVVVAASKPPPPGFTEEKVAAVLDAASNPALRRLQMTPLPKDTCCDRFGYDVTVTWADGSSRAFTTLSGVDQPPLFDDLLGTLA